MNESSLKPGSDRESLEARLGLRIGALLEDRAQKTPHDISERLRVAREQAVARARATRLAAPAEAQVSVGTGPVAVLGRTGGEGGWLRFMTVIPLLLLVAGMALIDAWHDRAQIEAAADIDIALLADDLPPDAYSDAGFVEFLQRDVQ